MPTLLVSRPYIWVNPSTLRLFLAIGGRRVGWLKVAASKSQPNRAASKSPGFRREVLTPFTLRVEASNLSTPIQGDLIATGTPVGVGIGFKPPKYLVNGDVVVVEMGGIGKLENTFIAE